MIHCYCYNPRNIYWLADTEEYLCASCAVKEGLRLVMANAFKICEICHENIYPIRTVMCSTGYDNNTLFACPECQVYEGFVKPYGYRVVIPHFDPDEDFENPWG